MSLSLSSGGLVQLDSLRGLLGSLLLVGHKRLHAGGEHRLIHHKMPSYVRFPAMKMLFAVALLLPGPPWILSLSRSYCRLRELIFNWKRCWKTYFVVLLAMSKF